MGFARAQPILRAYADDVQVFSGSLGLVRAFTSPSSRLFPSLGAGYKGLFGTPEASHRAFEKQLVGWVELCETHRFPSSDYPSSRLPSGCKLRRSADGVHRLAFGRFEKQYDGFRKGSTHPTGYGLVAHC